MADEVEWHPRSEKRVSELSLRFTTLLRQFARVFCERDDSKVITDAHVDDAGRALLRGEKKHKSRPEHLLCLVMEFGGPLVTGVGLTMLEHWPGWVFSVMGLVLFIASRYRE